jgi:hypothetical protein
MQASVQPTDSSLSVLEFRWASEVDGKLPDLAEKEPICVDARWCFREPIQQARKTTYSDHVKSTFEKHGFSLEDFSLRDEQGNPVQWSGKLSDAVEGFPTGLPNGTVFTIVESGKWSAHTHA